MHLTVSPLDTAYHIAARTTRLVVLTGTLAVLVACAGAPVQEMSNARQTLAAAEQVHAEKAAPVAMANARKYLVAAQAALDSGEYSIAREDALKAQQEALSALGISQRSDLSGRSPP